MDPKWEGKWAPTLVLCPKAMIHTWALFYEKTMPHLRVAEIDPRKRKEWVDQIVDKEFDVAIGHWEALRLEFPTLVDTKWYHVIGDEIHRIKNRKIKLTKCLKGLKTDYKTGLSGTPADNAPQDLWSILNWLYPREYSSFWRFFNTYIDHYKDSHGFIHVEGVLKPYEFSKKIEPFYIRRKKTEVLKDLPEKIYTTLWVDLGPQQRRIYDQMRKEMLTWVGENEDQPLDAPIVITRLLRLQQIALATPIFEKKTVRKKLMCVRPQGHEGDCQPDEIQPEQDWLLDRYNPPDEVVNGIDLSESKDTAWHGQYHYQEVDHLTLTLPSPKIDAAMEILLDNPDQQVVIFTQFDDSARLMAESAAGAGFSVGLYTGKTAHGRRNQIIEEFQAGSLQVFVGTIRSGGLGITLTAASTVIFLDRDWSPANNLQAEDRCHRLGQHWPVQIIDVMARRTVDLGRAQHFRQKWQWISEMLGDTTKDWQNSLIEEIDPEQEGAA